MINYAVANVNDEVVGIIVLKDDTIPKAMLAGAKFKLTATIKKDVFPPEFRNFTLVTDAVI